ncbi:MAG: 3-oxoacyl-ACP reductase family protein [Pseudomonadota bacterium]
MFNKDTIAGKIALVTGGAKGIGESIVLTLAKMGALVVFTYHSSSSLADKLLQTAEAEGLTLQALKCDIADNAQCEAIIESIIEQHQQIDILVNNSGIVKDNLLAAMETSAIEQVIHTNLIGTMQMTRAVIPHMMRKRAGKIVNIGSIAGEKPGRGQANYAASKAAIHAFTKAMAVELARRNIHVNAVAPGVIETEMSQNVRELAAEETLSKILLKRYGQCQEIANAVAFLASPLANYITGEILHVDGGFKMA